MKAGSKDGKPVSVEVAMEKGFDSPTEQVVESASVYASPFI